MQQKLIELEGEIDKAMITAGNINTSLSIMYAMCRLKIDRNIIEDLKRT
jgi:hypothetical protein